MFVAEGCWMVVLAVKVAVLQVVFVILFLFYMVFLVAASVAINNNGIFISLSVLHFPKLL